jgi:cobalt-zinc-cadmium efflux system outer membrane protein
VAGLVTAGLATAIVAGCAIYHPLPLGSDAPRPLASLSVPASTMLAGGLATHPFDPTDGLDATEVAMLAIAQSPDLKVQRAQAHAVRAQAFAAGLLPDPVFSATRDQPGAGQAGASTAYSRGISWDVGSLVTLASRRTAARRTDEQVDLSLLWSEWQTIAEARLRFARVQSSRQLVARLAAEAEALRPLAPRLNAALRRGFVSFDVASVGLTAASDVERQYGEARDALAMREHDLRELLGLRVDEPLVLVGDVDVPAVDEASLQSLIDVLPRQRPDLRALELGYAAEEARMRAAILGQFPALNVGVSRARDNTGITSSGIAVSISLPLFDRNRGAIAIERATREQLHEEYAQRMLTGRSDLARLRDARRILADRELQLAPLAAALDEKADHAVAAYERGLLDWTTYLALHQSALAAATELINLRETLAETRIGIATLAGGDWSQRSDTHVGDRP